MNDTQKSEIRVEAVGATLDREAWEALGFLSGLCPSLTCDWDQPMAAAKGNDVRHQVARQSDVFQGLCEHELMRVNDDPRPERHVLTTVEPLERLRLSSCGAQFSDRPVCRCADQAKLEAEPYVH